MIKKFLYLSPRILSILFILLLAMFSLDVFNEYQGISVIPALLMHLLPAMALALAVIIAWKWDLVGAIVFLGFAAWYIFAVGLDRHWSWYVTISLPSAIVGCLFIASWLQRKKNRI